MFLENTPNRKPYIYKYFRINVFVSRLRIVVLHEIANLGPSGLAGPIPAGGVYFPSTKKFKEFNIIIKNSTFCKFEKRDFRNDCPICKKFRVPRYL